MTMNMQTQILVAPDIDIDDLAMDEEEFPLGTDLSRFVAMVQEVIDELSKV